MTEEKKYIVERKVLFQIMLSGNNENVIRWYDENAALYDTQFNSCGFKYHRAIAEAVCEVAPDKSAVILDVGAGSGVTGQLLRENGYRVIDALDPCKAMLEIAEQRNVYRSLIRASVGTDHIPDLQGCLYDVLTAGAVFAPGVVYYESVPLLMSYLRAGGHLIFSMAEENTVLCPRLSKDNFMKLVKDWEQDKLCRLIAEKKAYHISNEPASVIVLQKM